MASSGTALDQWPRGSGTGLWGRFAEKAMNALSLFIEVLIRKATSLKIFINYKGKTVTVE